MDFVRRNAKYLFLFLFFFLAQVLFFNIQRGDTYVNFGFSYAVSRGEVPYLDFNMVIPPFAPYLYAVFLLFSKSILCLYLGQAFLLTFLFYFLFCLFGKKAWLYLVALSIPYPIAMATILFPGYNFLLLFLFFFLLYCEIEKKSDYCIGILLGLSFFTKQTVGGLLLLVSIYYLFVDYKKFLKRIVGFLIPVVLFFILFLIQGNFWEFVDLCFLGLFDFGHSNFYVEWFYFVIFIICMILLLIRIVRKPKDICNYYVLVFASCIYPIIDYYHVSLFLGAFLFLVLKDITIKKDIWPYCSFFAVAISLIWLVVEVLYLKDVYIAHYPNFEFSIVSKSYDTSVKKLERYLDTLPGEVVYFLRGSENYFFKIKHNLDITYFDLPNYGNYGYNGVDKLIRRIKKVKNSYFVIDISAYDSTSPTQQYIREAVDYIMEQGVKIKEIGYYQVYEMR